ncbi:MAG: hypothetical protein ACLFVC_07900 [Opitutales bacterium]
MHRPKKNKIHNPTLPDDQQDLVDERHLVDTEDSAEISFEDRARLYWMENRGFVTGCIVALAIIIIGFQGMRIYAQHSQARLQSEFNEAKAADALDAFAEDNANKELGGFAALQVADAKFEAEDYAAAAEFYQTAAEALGDTLLAGRARLGHAFALYHGGDTEAGLAELNAIAADSNLSDAARAEAAYHLAVHADVEGRDEAYESYAAQIQEMTSATAWAQRLNSYARQTNR